MSAGRGPVPGDQAVALAQAARWITNRDRWLLRMLHEHTVLTTPQLTRLRFAGSTRWAQTRLHDLRRWGVVDRFRPLTTRGSAPGHHVLGPLGARILAAEVGVDAAALGWRRDRALATAHRLSLAHDVAMNDLAVDLVTGAGQHVVEWWSPTRCRRVLGHHVRPDAYIAATVTPPDQPPPDQPPPDQPPTGLPPTGRRPAGEARAGGRGSVSAGGPRRMWEMTFEFDTGSTTLGVLAAKLRGYHDLAAATGVVVPVAVWVARPGREPGARRALAAAHEALPDPRRVLVLTGTPSPEHAVNPEAGAAGRVWSALHPGGRSDRVRLVDLAVPARPSLAEVLRGPIDVDDPYPGPRGGLHGGDTGGVVDGLTDGVGRVELPAPSPYPPPMELPPPAQVRQGRRDRSS